jgi:hypothetical protein
MKLYRRGTAVALFAASAACSVGALAGPANAAAQTFKQHDSFDPTGAVFACQPTDLTVTGGMIDESFEGVQDAQGVFHFTGTLVAHDVTLTNGATTYTLSGSDWFGATSTDPDGDSYIVGTDTSHFVIRNADGGVYAKVQVVEHSSPNGDYFVFDRGACETPPE